LYEQTAAITAGNMVIAVKGIPDFRMTERAAAPVTAYAIGMGINFDGFERFGHGDASSLLHRALKANFVSGSMVKITNINFKLRAPYCKITRMKANESGNVIFYVLIAVALLAALSYTVAQSTRGGVSSLSGEKASINAAEIIEYGNILTSAIAQTRLRGHLDTEVSMENTVVSGYENTNCADAECQIFNIAGGGVSYLTPKEEWLDSAHDGQNRYGEIYFNGTTAAEEAGTDKDDLVMIVPYLKKELCVAINKKLAIIPPSGDTPLEINGPGAMNVKFQGVYDTTSDTKISGAGTSGNAQMLFGKSGGCTQSSGGGSNPPAGSYHYYQVLIAR
jgi:hypothetical protein